MMKMMNTWRCMRRGMSTFPQASATRWWQHVTPAIINDPVKCLTETFLADSHPQKMNLAEGVFKDDEGNPLVFQCVREAERRIAANSFLDPMSKEVSSKFVEENAKLVYGDIIKEGRVAGIQALGGTGACNLFAMFQKQLHPDSIMYLPNPTWSIHHNIWRDAHVPKRTFRYYNPDSKCLNFPAFMDDVKNAPDDSFFLLHPCAHNPTGVDPSYEEWREISSLFKEKNHFPFFDMAYQGLASGDVEKDARAIRIFLEDGHIIGCAQSFTKNMGLYGHRVGCLSVLCKDELQASAIEDQLQQIANTMCAEQPIHGMHLALQVLTHPDIKSTWLEELKVMVTHIRTMRVTLREALEKVGSIFNWQHITDQVGIFWYSGLTPDQVDRLAKEFHIYMTADGRISMTGVTTENVDYLANAIHEVTKFDPIHDRQGRMLLKYPPTCGTKIFR